MKALLVPKDNLYVPDYSDNRALAVDIGGFFCRKINNIRNELGIIRAAMKEEDRVEDDPVVMENQRIYEFRHFSCEDVRSLVQKSSKKTCTLAPMPTSTVIACLEELLVVIMCILNSSLGSSQFYSLKEAIVHPRLKISGKDISFSNLRPVSNLQFISKLAKRAVFSQVHEPVMKFQL